ncbi:ABC transporter permease [Halioxenophilus sp. WMMB6]|uniref:ABC transporter permease n=1 Tax=Halioxenophilus sp. WMMB6 TaxID=3073815 RepID=UPI00295EC27D|nr:ABC transporter permease [Halioxenophilus sp. WMMB6]
MVGFTRRYMALVRKETRQMVRDRSNLGVGLLLPVTLILLFGYGLSFDVKNAPIAVVMADQSPTARQFYSALEGSTYLAPKWVSSMAEAETLLGRGEADAIVRLPVDFTRQLAAGQAQVQLLVNGIDATLAATLEGYVNGAIASVFQQQADRVGGKSSAGGVTLVQRIWFNETGDSTWYLVPGLIALVMTLIGAFLTSLLIAREWERGTFEALFVTPVRPLEMVLAKITPFMVIGIIDLVLCLLAAKFLFQVPVRGSLLVIVIASLLYLLVSLQLGLLISGVTRNQFQASQVAMLLSFLPALMLSGFIFDLRNVPLVIQVVSQILPATHYMALIKTQFLAGNDWLMALQKCAILLLQLLLMIIATRRTLLKKLD